MNNLLIGGADPRTGRPFAYYETLGGGHGAGPSWDGASALQAHMTNTRNTPIESLEHAYPLRVLETRVRRGSGGAGRYRGGDGIERTIEMLRRGARHGDRRAPYARALRARRRHRRRARRDARALGGPLAHAARPR